MIIETKTKTLEADVLNATLPVLVDFHAEWCQPCKNVAPILDEIAVDFAGKLTVLKLDVDANQETAAAYGVRSIPTVLLFDEGSVVATRTGSFTKSEIAVFLNNNYMTT